MLRYPVIKAYFENVISNTFRTILIILTLKSLIIFHKKQKVTLYLGHCRYFHLGSFSSGIPHVCRKYTERKSSNRGPLCGLNFANNTSEMYRKRTRTKGMKFRTASGVSRRADPTPNHCLLSFSFSRALIQNARGWRKTGRSNGPRQHSRDREDDTQLGVARLSGASVSHYALVRLGPPVTQRHQQQAQALRQRGESETENETVKQREGSEGSEEKEGVGGRGDGRTHRVSQVFQRFAGIPLSAIRWQSPMHHTPVTICRSLALYLALLLVLLRPRER